MLSVYVSYSIVVSHFSRTMTLWKSELELGLLEVRVRLILRGKLGFYGRS